jgi:hypothetical protein
MIAAALVLALLPGCDGFRNEAEVRQCRANLNTLSTEQAIFYSTYDRWATDIQELDDMSGRTVPLVCPSCGEGYGMTLDNGGYTVRCPDEDATHGSIQTGRSSWVEPRRST